MVLPDNHIDSDVLERYVAGSLGRLETVKVMAHLADCDYCLSLVDQMWLEETAGEALVDIPDLDQETALRVERRLVKRIHRSNLAGQVVKLGTQRFMDVALALMQPLLRGGVKPGANGVEND